MIITIVVNEGTKKERRVSIQEIGCIHLFFSGQFAVRLTVDGAEVRFIGDTFPNDFRVYTGFIPKPANPADYQEWTLVGHNSKFAVIARYGEFYTDEDLRVIVAEEEK